ncbi:MAG: hypothetical protein AAB255_06590 [Bacteroidota bacterium]
MGKSKFDFLFCNYCGKEKKMEILSQIEGDENRFWHRCTGCRHSFIIDRSTLKKSISKHDLTREVCVDYSPENTYEIGTHIYHQNLNDVGTITGKDKTSGGGKVIVVNFQKNGSRRLVESLIHVDEE